MAHLIYVKGFLLDESSGEFTADDGRKVKYHNARFYDSENQSIFKASVPDGAVLPVAQDTVTLVLAVLAGEKFCKLRYETFEVD